MLINSQHLPDYISSIEFPVSVFHHNSGQVAKVVALDELQLLIATGMVFGIGSRRRLRRIQLHERAVRAPVENRTGDEHSAIGGSFLDWRAETSFTVQRQQLSCGVVFRHHPKHCGAFAAQGMPELEASCL